MLIGRGSQYKLPVCLPGAITDLTTSRPSIVALPDSMRGRFGRRALTRRGAKRMNGAQVPHRPPPRTPSHECCFFSCHSGSQHAVYCGHRAHSGTRRGCFGRSSDVKSGATLWKSSGRKPLPGSRHLSLLSDRKQGSASPMPSGVLLRTFERGNGCVSAFQAIGSNCGWRRRRNETACNCAG